MPDRTWGRPAAQVRTEPDMPDTARCTATRHSPPRQGKRRIDCVASCRLPGCGSLSEIDQNDTRHNAGRTGH